MMVFAFAQAKLSWSISKGVSRRSRSSNHSVMVSFMALCKGPPLLPTETKIVVAQQRPAEATPVELAHILLRALDWVGENPIHS